MLASIFKMDFLKKFKGLLLDATVGLVKQYQSKAMDLVKLEAVACYVRGVQLLRQQVLLVAGILFLVVVSAVAVIIVPLVWLALAPFPYKIKLTLALILGLADIAVPLGILAYLLSEKKWMEFSKSDELLASVMKKD
jgi:hypothetical protein